MRGLYLSNIDPQQSIGYMPKILGQAMGFSKWRYDMEVMTFSSDAEIILSTYQANQIPVSKALGNAGKNLLLRRYRLLRSALKHIVLTKPQFLYLRYPRSEPLYLYFLFRLRVQFPNLIILAEFPTFPYDPEYKDTTNLKDKLVFALDKLTRNYLKYFVSRIVSINYDFPILGISTISIDNGVDVKNFPLLSTEAGLKGENFRMIGVANVEPWHGYDRILRGLGQYYRQSERSDCTVTFHIVGAKSPYKDSLTQLIEKEGIAHAVTFHPPTEGKVLDDLFDNCHLAIGVLGGHRKGLEVMSPLKNREYCARGIPFVFSHVDPDFSESFNYGFQVTSGENPLDIEKLINFTNQLANESNVSVKMRNYAYEALDWSVKLKPVTAYLDEQVNPVFSVND
jgi:glycosyltransferase involved in cell wall biosynthesis